MKRRRYDTVELVGDIRRERRNAILLATAGVGILVALVLIYGMSVGNNDVPDAPSLIGDSIPGVSSKTEKKAEAPEVEPKKPDELAAKEGAADEAKAPEEKAPEPKAEAETKRKENKKKVALSKIRIVLTKKAPLWVNGKKIGKVKKHRLTLGPGTHEIKARFGKKTVVQKLAPKPGLSYEVRFDARKKRVKVKKLGK